MPDPLKASPEKRPAMRSRDIYKVQKKNLPENTFYEIEIADGYLSMNFASFLQDSIPEDYLSDSEIALACISICVLAWNLGILSSDKKMKNSAKKYEEKKLQEKSMKETAALFGKNFKSTLQILIDQKNNEYGKFHDFIKSWTIESVEDECCDCGHDHEDEEYEDIQINTKGCALEELEPGFFE